MRNFEQLIRNVHRSPVASAVAIAVTLLVTPTISADEITLKDGRKLVGSVVKKNGETLVVELTPGNMILVNQSEIKAHPQNSKGEAGYVEALKKSSDTIESHLQMAIVAQKSLLPDHARAHYERVLELDPDHKNARAALGYTLNEVDGQWILRDELMRKDRGKTLAGGRYRFPEIVAMQEAEEKFKNERNVLAREISRALSNLNNPRNSAKAQATLDGLVGPLGSAAITFVLYGDSPVKKISANPAQKAVCIPILKRLGDPLAIQTLIRMCTETGNSSEQIAVRQQAFEVVKELAPEAAFHALLGELRSSDNARINLAAEMLQELGDERAILPLIERLVTFKRMEFGGGNATNAGMSNGDVSFSKGSPKIVQNVPIENPGVLGALVAITGQNLKYNPPDWLKWYDANYVAHTGDLRRDP